MSDLSTPHGLRVSAADADQALIETLRALTDEGAEVGRGQGRGPSREVLDFSVELTNARDRIPVNPDASFDLTVAVARWPAGCAGSAATTAFRCTWSSLTSWRSTSHCPTASNASS
jgi:hypothetical protein